MPLALKNKTNPFKMPHDRAAILKELRGRSFTVCDLQSTFDSWPCSTNPVLPEIREEVDRWLLQNFPTHPKLQKLRDGDYGLFGATWWPRASFERLRVGTLFALWLFLWDDEIDSDDGHLAYDSDGAHHFRCSTLDFIRYTLGLQPTLTREDSASNNIIRSFETFAKPLRAAWTIGQRETFLVDCEFFMEKSEVEQRLRLDGRFPTESEYWRFRLGTSAVPLVLALNAYCCHLDDVPPSTLAHPAYAQLLHHANVNICAVNDLLSVKKEVAQGGVDHLVAIFFASTASIQAASDMIMAIVVDSARKFQESAKVLAAAYDTSEQARDLVRNLTEGCAFYVTGNLQWSLRTGRYGIHASQGDGFVVQL